MRHVLMALLVATCLLSAHAAAQEVECYIICGGLRRLTLSFASGQYTLVGETEVGQLPPGIWHAAMTPDGELLALDSSIPRLVLIDTETAQVTTIVSLNLDGPMEDSDIAVVPPSQIYLSQETRLYSVDRATGDVSLIGDTGFTLEALGSYGESLYAAGWSTAAPDGAFMRLSTLTAQPTLITAYPPSSQGERRITALSSSWPHLWASLAEGNVWGGGTAYVGPMNPATGYLVSAPWQLSEFTGGPLVWAVELRGPALQVPTVPVLGRSALALLVLVLAAAGIVAIRKLVG